MINILIEDPFIDLVDRDLLVRAAERVLLTYSDIPESDLSIVVDDDERLRDLNRTYLDIDSPTDVLSFPSEEDEVDPETGHIYLGDVIISYPRAVEQAAASHHPIKSELQLLAIHGVLHLLGFDHAEPEEKKIMWDAQKEVLSSLGVQLSRFPE